MRNFEYIHIGMMISQKVTELEMDKFRICKFLGCPESEIEKMYQSEGLDAIMLLKWSKLLEYDFFRIYSQHLILFSPPSNLINKNKKETQLPQFRKNLYTKEIIDFILELLENKQKTILQIVEEYKIPKTTLYRWINKYKK